MNKLRGVNLMYNFHGLIKKEFRPVLLLKRQYVTCHKLD